MFHTKNHFLNFNIKFPQHFNDANSSFESITNTPTSVPTFYIKLYIRIKIRKIINDVGFNDETKMS